MTFNPSLKILKLGTWIGGILETLVVLVVTAVMIFPVHQIRQWFYSEYLPLIIEQFLPWYLYHA
jgi:hypothetical protein